MAESKITLAYWRFPGKAQPARYLMEYLHIPYEDKYYTSDKDWFENDKKNLGLPFPNLPYIIDGDLKMSESVNIVQYLAKKSGHMELLGKKNEEFRVNELAFVIDDIWQKVVVAFRKENPEEKKKEAEVAIPKIQNVIAFLGNKEFIMGYLTVADFYFVNVLDFLNLASPETYVKYANLYQHYILRFKNLPGIKEFLLSNRSLPWKAPSNSQIKLGYWKIGGKAQAIRYALEYLEIPYQEYNYENREQWFEKDKKTLGMDFPNLPYIIDGNNKLTESKCLVNYVVKKSGKVELLGKGQDFFKVQEMVFLLDDVFIQAHDAWLVKTPEEKQSIFNKGVKPQIEKLLQFLGKKQFLMGYLTTADFFFSSYLDFIQATIPIQFKEIEASVAEYQTGIKNVPKIKEFLASGRNLPTI